MQESNYGYPMIKHLLCKSYFLFLQYPFFTLLKHNLNQGYSLNFCYFLATFFPNFNYPGSLLQPPISHIRYFQKLSFKLPLFGNMDDSNRNDKICNLKLTLLSGSKVLKMFTQKLILFQCFYLQHFVFIERWVTGMTYYLFYSLLSFVNCFSLTS